MLGCLPPAGLLVAFQRPGRHGAYLVWNVWGGRSLSKFSILFASRKGFLGRASRAGYFGEHPSSPTRFRVRLPGCSAEPGSERGEHALHCADLRGLGADDALREGLRIRVLPGGELGLGHIDRAGVVHDHLL